MVRKTQRRDFNFSMTSKLSVHSRHVRNNTLLSSVNASAFEGSGMLVVRKSFLKWPRRSFGKDGTA